MATEPTPIKRTQACNFCRNKKIRCSGGERCSNCVLNSERCFYNPRKRRQRQGDSTGDPVLMARKIARLEELLRHGRQSSGDEKEPERPFNPKTSPSGARLLQEETSPRISLKDFSNVNELYGPGTDLSTARFEMVSPPGSAHTSMAIEKLDKSYSPNDGSTTLLSFSQSVTDDRPWEALNDLAQSSLSEKTAHLYPASDTLVGSSPEDHEESSLFSAASSGLEYQGPRTSMAICSRAGVEWVRERVKDSNFHVTAHALVEHVARRLKTEKPLSLERQAEPSEQDAWRYTRAYFNESYDAALGIVHRPWFESKLLSHFRDGSTDDGPAWYALRNIVYASGCRIEMSKKTGFREAHQASWPWFENALSVHSLLLYWQTTVIGVQALTVMAYYAEAISSPLLQYMLLSSAYRLAVAKGLHRQPSPSWGLPPGEDSLRNCTFWALYCLEKDISCRSGRPSAIEDDEITCQIPTSCLPGGSLNIRYFNVLVRLSQLYSIVDKRLSSARLSGQTPEELVKNVQELMERLDSLKRSFQIELGLELPMNLSNIPEYFNIQQALFIQFTYYNLLWESFTPLLHPWYKGTTTLKEHPAFRSQIQQAASVVATTSRAAIMDSKFVHIDATCPLLLGWYTQMYASTNLFISILTDPGAASASSDLTLLEVSAGYFARVEVESNSALSVTFTRDFVNIARKAIENSKAPSQSSIATQVVNRAAAQSASGAEREDSFPQSSVQDGMATQINVDEGTDDAWLGMDFTDDFDLWSTMMPVVFSEV